MQLQQVIGFKACRGCAHVKHRTEFYSRMAFCKPCHIKRRGAVPGRASVLKHKYGMTHADYERMVVEHGDKCALCGSSEKGRGHNRAGKPFAYWSIDHCHTTNVVRGLLCHGCNSRLGSYEKLRNTVGFEAVEKYLKGKMQ